MSPSTVRSARPASGSPSGAATGAAGPVFRVFLLLLLLSQSLGAASVLAQPAEPSGADEGASGEAPRAEPLVATEDPEPWLYLDELERDTPRGAMRGFLVSSRAGDWRRAARYLDLSPLSPDDREEQGAVLAQRLKRVLDRRLWVELDRLADEPRGDLSEEGVAADRERVGVIALPGGERIEILLERVREDGERVWKVAASTVERVPALYDAFGYGPLEDWLPAPFFELSLLSIQLWQWIGLALLLVVAWAVAWVLSKLALLVIHPLARRSDTDIDDRLLENGAPPLHFMLGLGVFTIGVLALQLAVPVERFLIQTVQALLVFSLVWLTFRLVDIGSHWSQQRLAEGGQVAAISMLPLARKGVKLFLAALGVLAVMQNIGLNVTALIAGLGVGGLAIALAAQQTIENLFGGMTLVVDQPVRVGDFCRFDGDKVGTVE
ncbi:MAG TPA: hypothetical protein VMT85_22115, partial [Thermoanaerobaculia bacterium]|nr:hypothetical protein [Thermoanaerobaculia bacterium]